jgi:hypothetical protein
MFGTLWRMTVLACAVSVFMYGAMRDERPHGVHGPDYQWHSDTI